MSKDGGGKTGKGCKKKSVKVPALTDAIVYKKAYICAALEEAYTLLLSNTFSN